jgi:hypothetical protein
MTNILLGESLQELETYMEHHEERSPHYHRNLAAAKSWIEKLRFRAATSSAAPSYSLAVRIEDTKPLEWVESMLQEKPDSRWTAAYLVTQIQRYSDTSDHPYLGLCCIDDSGDESVESVASSI